MHRVRMSVRENRLVSTVLPPSRYIEYIESRGRGWVLEAGGAVVAFAVAELAGWTDAGITPDGERRFELCKPGLAPPIG